MLAKLIDAPFNSPEWIFETKWDGYRALAYIENGEVDLISRNENSFNHIFPLLVKELQSIHSDVILDGEVVLLDKNGRSDFQLMQNYQRTQEGNLFYYVFDILYKDDEDLRERPLMERKEILKEVFSTVWPARIRYSEYIEEQGIKLFKAAQKHHLEGIIGKEKNSSYVSKRSSAWVKIKTHAQQEVVIGGFTAPRGSREKFGALLLGVYKGNKLVYVGHTGGGFSRELLNDVYSKLKPLIQKKCPFAVTPKANEAVTWVKPKLVCEITFSEWTSEGIARQPIFHGLRMDKKPKEVVLELPKSKKTVVKKPHQKSN